MLINYTDFLARSHVFSIPTCLLYGWSSMCICNAEGMIIHLPFIATLSIIASLCLIGQYPHTVGSRSSLFCGQPHTGLSCERPLWCPIWNPVLTKGHKFGWWTSAGGIQSSFTMCRLNLNFKILGEILILGDQSSLTMCKLNLNFKILGEILVSHTRGVNHLSPSADWILTLNFRWDPGQWYWGVSHHWSCAH